MKKTIKKRSDLFMAIGIIMMVIAQFYPEETQKEKYIAAAIYTVAAICFLLSLLGFISRDKK
jgi:predicted Na+-dependent transporter